MIKKLILSLIIFCASCSQLLASEIKDQKWQDLINGSINLESYNNNTYNANSKRDEIKDIFFKATARLAVKITNNLSLRSTAKFEVINQREEELRRSELNEGENRTYENEGIFLEELNLNYNKDRYFLSAGKLTVDFGTAWRPENNNIWLRDIPRNDYRQNEKLGFSAAYKTGNQKTTGEYLFSISSFTNDRKHLENSVITKRDGFAKSEGRPGDDSGLSSYALSLNIKYDFDHKEELSYHFAYLNLAVNEKQSLVEASKIKDSKGTALNMNYKYPINENLLLDGLIEYVFFKNANGNLNNETSFLTTNLVVNLYQNWSLILGRNLKFDKFIDQKNIQTTFETSLGYKFAESSVLNGFKILIGHKEEREGYKINLVRRSTYGIFVNYVKNF